MKSSTKYIVALIAVFFLLMSLFISYQITFAQISLEKVSIDHNTIRIQNSFKAPILDIQLIENTNQCLVDCYAILKFHPYQTVTLPQFPDNDFRWDFLKASPDMPGLKNYRFQILENASYVVSIPIFENQTYDCINNITGAHETCWEDVQTGITEETNYKDEYQPFKFWGETLKSGKDYYIKLIGEKYPVLGENNIDWIPTIMGIQITEWQWWNGSWSYRLNMTIDKNKLLSQLSNFTMLVQLDASRINYSHTNNDGSDIRFIDSGDNEINYYIERWNESGYSYVWVRVPTILNTSNTTVYIYYGNETAVVSNANKKNAFSDQNMIGRWDLNGNAYDTMESNNGTVSGASSLNAKIANGYKFVKASSNYISFSQFTSGTLGTLCAWFNITNLGSYNALISEGISSGAYPYFVFEVGNGGSYFGWDTKNTTSAPASPNAIRGNVSLSNNTWYHGCVVSNGTIWYLYFNGSSEPITVLAGSNNGDWFGDGAGNTWSFGALRRAVPIYSDAVLDEVKLYSDEKTAGWIKALYLSESDSLLTFGAEETEPLNSANESEGDTAIENGIQNSLGTNATIYTDQQIYIRYLNGSQLQGQFDKVTVYGNQTWVFNYITAGETPTNMDNQNLSTTVYVWEKPNLTTADITSQVSTLINATKV